MKLSKNEIATLIGLQKEFMQKYPLWRKGQTLFNVLYMTHPTIADEIRATDYDPYYKDDRIEECIKFISE